MPESSKRLPPPHRDTRRCQGRVCRHEVSSRTLCLHSPPGVWSRRPHQRVHAMSWQGHSAGGEGVRDLILPQEIAISRSKKELNTQLPCGFDLCLTVSTRHRKHWAKRTLLCCGLYYLWQSSEEQTDWATLGNRILKPHHWWYNFQMMWSLNLDTTDLEKWKTLIWDMPSKTVLLPHQLKAAEMSSEWKGAQRPSWLALSLREAQRVSSVQPGGEEALGWPCSTFKYLIEGLDGALSNLL